MLVSKLLNILRQARQLAPAPC